MARCDYNDYQVYVDNGGPEGIDAYDEAMHWEAEAQYEAERAWLVAAESPTNDDIAFEQWERDRGCHLDPQSGYDA